MRQKLTKYATFESAVTALGLLALYLLYTRGPESAKEGILKNGQFFGVIFAGIATPTTVAVCNSWREVRDVERQNRFIQAQEELKERDELFARGETLLQNYENHTAALHFQQAKALLLKADSTKSDWNKQLATCLYKIALCYYRLSDFDKSIKHLEEILEKKLSTEEDHVYIPVINLLGMDYFKKGEDDRAKQYFSESLALDKNQTFTTIIYLFLSKEYELVLSHMPFQLLKPELPYPMKDKDSAYSDVLILDLTAQALKKIHPTHYLQMISLYEAALSCLPKPPGFHKERIELLHQCADAYYQQSCQSTMAKESKSINSSEMSTVEIVGIVEVKPSNRKLSKIELMTEARSKWESGQKLLKEFELITVKKTNLDNSFILSRKNQFKECLEKTASSANCGAALYAEKPSSDTSQGQTTNNPLNSQTNQPKN